MPKAGQMWSHSARLGPKPSRVWSDAAQARDLSEFGLTQLSDFGWAFAKVETKPHTVGFNPIASQSSSESDPQFFDPAPKNDQSR